jgi:hypothetical protein
LATIGAPFSVLLGSFWRESAPFEGARGARIVLDVGAAGAARFNEGVGRHGAFEG